MQLANRLFEGATGTDPGAFRQWLLAQLAESFSVPGAIWRRSRTLSPPHSINSAGVPSHLTQALFRNQDQVPLFQIAFGTPGHAFSLRGVLHGMALEGTALFDRVLRPLDIHDLAMVVLREPRHGLDTEIILVANAASGPFDPKRLARLQGIAPLALSAARVSLALQAAAPAAEHWHRPLALTDLQGNLLDAQDAFLDLVEMHFPRWKGPRLPFDVPAPGRTLRVAGTDLLARAEAVGDLNRLRLWTGRAADGLTRRERAVAEGVASGLTYKEIARNLQITPSTVSNHLQRVYGKLEVSSRADLARRWREIGADAALNP